MGCEIVLTDPVGPQDCGCPWDSYATPERRQRIFEEIRQGLRFRLVALADGELVGEVSLVLETTDSQYTIPGVRAYLSRLVVRPDCRRRGIATALLAAVEVQAARLGYAQMALGVDIANVNARWLYERNGYRDILFVGEDADGRYVKLLKRL